MKGYSLWSEPRIADPPPRTWRDWALVVVLLPTALLEAVLRPDVVWRPVAIALCLLVIATLLWRRSAPLLSVALVFGAILVIDIAAVSAGREQIGLYTTAAVLLLPYALFRWASGREAVIGASIMVLAMIPDFTRTSLVDAVVGTLILLSPMELGAVIRYRTNARVRETDQIKMQEREQLARELHDTVAHHVSAIVVQAQAGRAVAATDPAAALGVLEVIEDAASRSLAEMRALVGALRQNEPADLSPQLGLADIEQLAAEPGPPRVEVELSGDLKDLRPSVEAAVYRLAQESITNARRHARAATVVNVRVVGDDNFVRITVHDDGRSATNGRGSPGYGLAGMTERATLLGGTFVAGPSEGRGWRVTALLPKAGAPG